MLCMIVGLEVSDSGLTVARPALAEELDDPWVEPKEIVWPHALSIGIDPSVSMPLGDWSIVAGVGVGVGLRLEYQLTSRFRAALRGGGVFHLVNSEINTHEFVGMAAFEVFVRPSRPEFLWVEGGVGHLRFQEGPEATKIEPSTDPAAGLGVGYDGGRFSVRIGALFPAVNELQVGFAIVASLNVRVFGLLANPRHPARP